MKDNILLLFMILLTESVFSQKLKHQQSILIDVPVDQGFVFINDLITASENKIYLLQSYKRPLELEYDSVNIFEITSKGAKFVSNLQKETTKDIAFPRSLGITKHHLYFTDNLGVYLFDRVKKHDYRFNRFVATKHVFNNVGEFNQFKTWHLRDNAIYTADYYMTITEVDACRPMEINKISIDSLAVLQQYETKICGTNAAHMNMTWPLDFSPSGKYLAYCDVMYGKLRILHLGDSLTTTLDTSLALLKGGIQDKELLRKHFNDYVNTRDNDSKYKLDQLTGQTDKLKKVVWVTDSKLILFGSAEKRSFCLLYDLDQKTFKEVDLTEWNAEKLNYSNYNMLYANNQLYVLNIVTKDKKGRALPGKQLEFTSFKLEFD